MIYDIIVIGTGITGSSICYELSKYDLKVLALEKENDVSMGTSKANSGIVHAGYDPLPETKMARLNVLGSKLIAELAGKLNVHYKQVGSLVIGRNKDDYALINSLYQRGIDNKVEGLRILKTYKEVHDLEPNIASDINYALYAPSAGIVSPWELTLALMENAKHNGVELRLLSKVTNITKLENKNFEVEINNKDKVETRYIINCSGTHADEMYNFVLGENQKEGFKISPCKGEYYLLDKSQGNLVNKVVFQTPSKLGKGVLVAPTVHGNLIVGPNATYEVVSKEDTSTSQKSIDYVRESAKISVPNIDYRLNIRNFSGVRATIEDYPDFLIEESKLVPHFINFAGIKSPGLSCGPAFGIEAITMLKANKEKLTLKKDWKMIKLPKYFKEMSIEEKQEAIKKDPRYGKVICRCETVTEKEIIDSLHSEIPACSLDGIKRRTNAGMGRCQQGFCGPKVFEIIQKETSRDVFHIYQDKEGSSLVLDVTKKEAK